jgi:hypothetical protein
MTSWQRPSPDTVESYFTAIRDAVGVEHLWADVELFNWGNPLFPTDSPSGAYHAASLARLNEQLWMVRDGPGGTTSRRVAWVAQIHMSGEHVHRAPGAARLAATYRALYGLGGTLLTTPATPVTWQTPPSTSYPDTGNAELVDMHAGDPRNFAHSSWVGLVGNATVTLDLGAAQELDWVGVHLLADRAPGITLPTSMALSCSPDASGESFISVATVARPFSASPTAQTAEWVFSNPVALDAPGCRRVRLALDNGAWTFLSEVELSRD